MLSLLGFEIGVALLGSCYLAWNLLPLVTLPKFARRLVQFFGGFWKQPTTALLPDVSSKASVENLTPGRKPGEWRSVEFLWPRFEPFLDDIASHKPTPYRPFRWADTYPINLGIRAMPFDMWLELDQEYLHTHGIRAERTATRGEKAVRTLPFDYPLVSSSIPLGQPLGPASHQPISSECRATPAACAREVCSEMASYLALKYPKLYRVMYAPCLSPTGKPFDLDSTGNSFNPIERVKGIEMVETGEKWDLDVDDPMKVAGLLGQDDLAIMQEREDGQVYFVAGSICTAGFWRLEDKIGMPLDEIHHRGKVPQYREKLQFSMNRFFLKLRTDKPVQRNNYFFQIDDNVAWSAPTNGPEEIFDQAAKGPREGAEGELDFIPPTPTKNPDAVFFRTERQTLRRMPKTGCILFTVRTYFLRVADFVQEAGVPGRLANAIRTWPKDVAEYKGYELYGPTLLPWLDQKHAEQLASGITSPSAVVHRYPF